ncbi:MAG TPA: chitobiase/beta-hexosaminidase C-terminal domain-containing protein, partial [Bryobacteraceae bacterium]|nr:chitobiase/beta-hexosaminidase C-terminal domain-containing protein [Bryobacteraceae bacterium]
MSANPPRLSALAIGDQTGLQVIGTYADGSNIDLTNSTQTTFVTQPAGIATVSAGGLVTALGSGSAQIIVNGSLTVPVTVDPPITINPVQATLTASQTRTFISVVANAANPSVTWQLNPPIGTISADGLYTAPASLDSAQSVTLTATSVADPTLTASAQITLSPAASINVVPAYAVLYAAQPQQFTAISSNAGTAGVNWSISPAGAGTIDNTGLYTAPVSIAALQSVTITAASVSNPSVSGSTTIWISPQPFALLLQPPVLSLGQGLYNGASVTILTNGFTHAIAFSVSGLPDGVTAVFNDPGSVVTFTASPTIAQGLYTVNVIANDTVYPPLSQSQPLTLSIGGGFLLTASSPTVTTIPGGSVGVTVTESVLGGYGLPVLWVAGSSASGIAATFPYTQSSAWQQTGPGSTVLLITVSPSVPPGAYQVMIGGQPYIGGTTRGGTASTTITVVVQAQTGPSILSMSPNPGTQTTQLFTFAYSDASGVANLTSAGVLVNATPTTASACYVLYSVSAQTVSLRNDADTGWVGSATLGANKTLSNSQCILDASGSQAVISGSTLNLTLVLTPVNPVIGVQNVYGIASDSGSTSAWLPVGVWTISATSLPSPWRDQDIGGPGPNGPGSSMYTPATSTFQVVGTSNSASSPPDLTQDWFHYTYQPLAGDGTIVARLVDLNNVFQYTSGGLMIRASTDPGSAFVYLNLQPNNGGCTVGYRAAAGSPASYSGCTSSAAAPPVWLRLIKQGSAFSTQTSPDGVTWTNASAPITVSMSGSVLVGLVAASNLIGNISWADFDNVGITAVSTTPVAAPTFSPGAGTYATTQTVTIATTTPGATINYTTDGAAPSEIVGTLYSGPITIAKTTTIKAIAFASGMPDSSISVAAFAITPVAAPTFTPVAGTYTSTQTVTIATTSPGASINYTTDGTAPTETAGTLYTGPIAIAKTTTIKAIAFASGMPDSSISVGVFTITPVAAPAFTPIAGTYATTQSVTIATATPGASINYTTNGTAPSETVGTPYTGPIAISKTTTIKAIAFASNMPDSSISVGAFTITPVAAPTFSPVAGTYTTTQMVTIATTTPGASINYTTNGTAPSETIGTLYIGPIAVAKTTTIKAIAFGGNMPDSSISVGTFTITPVAAPAFSPIAGTYTTTQTVTISTATPGASISYTTNGTAPSETNGTLYTGPITVAKTTTIKAIAFGSNMPDSTISVGTFTITPVAAPTFSPIAGTYTTTQTVTLSTTTPGASINYTTNGAAPSETIGTPYTGPITVAKTTTIKAIAFGSNMPDSSISVGTFTITPVAAPTFSPIAGTYTTTQTVTLATATSGASINYTTDGTAPSETAGTLYTGPIAVAKTTTIKAIAFGSNMPDSPISVGT